MKTLAKTGEREHEQVIALEDRASGLRGFIAIHDTRRGPALGGTRLWRYESEEAARADALRLSRAMTYKAALAELPCGGGKAVLLDHAGLKRDQALEAYGRVVESLGGRFFTGCDVGVGEAELAAIARGTRYLAHGSERELGNLSEFTAVGVWQGLRACLDFAGLKKARVAIQGVGSVGLPLARLLRREGMELVLADVDEARARQAGDELGAKVVPPEEILSIECDVLAPCALGGVVNQETLPRLQARIVCGSANNVLASAEAGEELARCGVLYAPDYLVNAGGLIRGAEFYLLKRKDSRASLERIYQRTKEVLRAAQARGLSTQRVADEMAEARLRGAKT